MWLRETNQYSTRPKVVRMIVGNKLDLESDRQVRRDEGEHFARLACSLFCESSAKSAEGVQYAFEELVRKILEVPELLEAPTGGTGAVGVQSGDGDDETSCAC